MEREEILTIYKDGAEAVINLIDQLREFPINNLPKCGFYGDIPLCRLSQKSKKWYPLQKVWYFDICNQLRNFNLC